MVSPDGSSVSGNGEAGASVTITDPDGNEIGSGTVQPDGSFTVAIAPPQINGETLTVVLGNANGDSDPATVVAPNVDTGDDVPAPATGLVVSPDGSSVSGNGEAGASVTITDPDGNEIGSGTVQPDGSFTVAIAPPQINGETLTVVLGNANGDSDPATVVAPNVDAGDDVPAPATGLVVSPDGSSVSGNGEAGASVTITDPDGNEIGSGTVQPDGSFTVAIAPPQINGETLTVVLGNANGDSDPATVVAPNVDAGDDVPAPATNLVVSPDGSSVSGNGEAGASVTITDPDGNEIGSGTVQPDGSFTVAIAPPQINGETLTVVLGNANGDSDPATVVAPNVDAGDDVPAPATGLVVSPDGSSVSGNGEAGASVTITDPDGNEIGSGTVQPDGSFTVAIAPPQINGETLTVVLGNANGDSDPATVVAPVVNDDVPDIATNLLVSADGTSLTGNGEAGATVTVTDAGGNEIGTGTVLPDGSFTVGLTPPQIDGQILTVVLGNANGNSDPATVLAPNVDTDDDVPAPATNLVVGPDGASVSGNGEAGTTVTITDPDGNEIGSGTVQLDGSFTVAIAPPQTNGEILIVVLTNAFGDSDPAAIAAPVIEVELPDPATNLVVSPDGSSVSGTGEAGATVTITDPDGNEIGSGTVQPDGSFTVAIAPPQINGETLTVVLGNANGDSDPATVLAPVINDDVPDIAINLLVSADGTSLTGNGEAGAAITITDPDGNEIGTGTVQPDGSFTVSLTPPQTDGETLTVVLSNANGDSGPATVVAPVVNDEVPEAAINLLVSPDGTTLTGNGEPGAGIRITNPDGDEIGTGTVQPDGTFTVTLIPPQTAGETLTVVLSNANGDSGPATVSAPLVEEVLAFDNVASAFINLEPTVTANVSAGSAGYLALLNLLNVVDLQVLSVNMINFNVAHGHRSDLQLEFNSLLGVGALSDLRAVVQVRDESGSWVGLNGEGQASFLSLNLLSGGAAGVSVSGLPAGEYRAFMAANGVVNLSVIANLTGVRTDYDYNNILGTDAVNVSGNVLTDAGVNSGVDVITDDTIVFSVQGTPVPLEGATIDGTYGQLTIFQDGTYTYVPNDSLAGIGKVDSFSYTIRDTVTQSESTANLHIRIDSESVDLEWSAPGDDAQFALEARDDQATAALSYRNVVSPTATAKLGADFGLSGGLVKTGQTTVSFTVNANDKSNVVLIVGTDASLGSLSVLPTYTLQLLKWNEGTSTWVPVPGGNASGTALASLPLLNGLSGLQLQVPGDLSAGSYQVKATISTVALSNFSSAVYLTRTDTHLNQYEVNSNPGVSGNVLADDDLGSPATKLMVQSGGSYQDIPTSGLTVVGSYGNLLIQQDGSYHYSPTGNPVHHTADVVDIFQYQVVAPNGETSQASLEITVDVSGAGVVNTGPSPLAFFDDIPDLDLDLASNDESVAAEDAELDVSLEELVHESSEEIALSFEEETASLATDEPPVDNTLTSDASEIVLTEPVAQNDDLWNQPDNYLG
ncbi:hypothetical protein C4F51_18175 [Cellvibrio sp. KB43]|uniref:Bacterial Ig domain-containing protein n=1 Tax=Cellvibrio polysaccharolyticus TaxID=2082724 RepID=A0A928V9R6_9GAMM|nr:hypothetical protein [Cellvibrio polysaccharolyticus]